MFKVSNIKKLSKGILMPLYEDDSYESERTVRLLPDNTLGIIFKATIFNIYKSGNDIYIESENPREYTRNLCKPADSNYSVNDIKEKHIGGVSKKNPFAEAARILDGHRVPEEVLEINIPEVDIPNVDLQESYHNTSSNKPTPSSLLPEEKEPFENFLVDLKEDAEDFALDGKLTQESFTGAFLDLMVESKEIDDYQLLEIEDRGVSVNAYIINEDENEISIFSTIMQDFDFLSSASSTKINNLFSGVQKNLIEKSLLGIPPFMLGDLEKTNFSKEIKRLSEENKLRINSYIITNGISNINSLPSEDLESYSITYKIWDLRRLYRRKNESWGSETIDIDFEKEFDFKMPILSSDSNSEYQTYVSIIPGSVLSGLYHEHTHQLLEGNVRSYLQGRGKVNKGILETLNMYPQRFVTYNNGISVVAFDAQITDDGRFIKSCKGFQIVNGAQTTASIHRAKMVEGMDISSVNVQVKLTVVNESEANDVIPLISKFANTQNVIRESDLSANDPFHQEIEKISRKKMAPPKEDGDQRGTYWYYERARGQYSDDLWRIKNQRSKRIFRQENPSKQKFGKTDLAKYYLAWQGDIPNKVALGAQKAFKYFKEQIQPDIHLEDVDDKFFEDLIAKTIVFKELNSICRRNKISIIAQTIPYTISVFRRQVSDHETDFLSDVWKNQQISYKYIGILEKYANMVHSKFQEMQQESGRLASEIAKGEDTRYKFISDKRFSYEI